MNIAEFSIKNKFLVYRYSNLSVRRLECLPDNAAV